MYGVYAYNYLRGGTIEDTIIVDGENSEKGELATCVEWNKSLLYSPNMVGNGYAIFNAKLTRETNKAGSFTFSMMSTHPALSVGVLNKLKTIIVVFKNDKEIWRGRILDDTVDFYGNHKFVCEGELAFLNDIILRPREYSKTRVSDWLNATVGYIRKYTSSPKEYFSGTYIKSCSPYRRIRVGEVFVTELEDGSDENDKKWRLSKIGTAEYATVLGAIQDVLLDTYGGYIELKRDDDLDFGVLNYYSYDNSPAKNANIVFGKNLLDLSRYIDASSVYTSILPIGKGFENSDSSDETTYTIRDVRILSDDEANYRKLLDGYAIESIKGAEMFGTITKKVEFNSVTSGRNLMNLAMKLLDESIEQSTTITISAIDLSLLDVNYEDINVNDMVPVTSIPHGLYNVQFRCSKIELDILNPTSSIYTFGRVPETLTKKQMKFNAKINSIS